MNNLGFLYQQTDYQDEEEEDEEEGDIIVWQCIGRRAKNKLCNAQVMQSYIL